MWLVGGCLRCNWRRLGPIYETYIGGFQKESENPRMLNWLQKSIYGAYD